MTPTPLPNEIKARLRRISPLMSSKSGFDFSSDDFSGLVRDFVKVLLDDCGAAILKASYIPVNGAEYTPFVFELNVPLLEAKISATLRALGLEISDRDCAHNKLQGRGLSDDQI
jgi:hypothetical protein